MRVDVLAVGTELLLGDIVNTNASWLGRRLADGGLDVVTSVVVGDNVGRIAEAVRAALDRSGAVVLSGGLGPTQDDLTREALAQAAGVRLHRDGSLAEALLQRYASLGRRMPAMNLRQADLPEGATAIPNRLGTAPGVRLELLGGVAYAMPGVPHEMEAMFDEQVLPDLLVRAGEPAAIVSRTVRTAGMWESAVAEALADLDQELDATGNPTLAFLAGRGEVRVRITAKAAGRDEALRLLAPVEERVRSALGEAVYGADEDTLASVVHDLLRESGATVATAESLTGGLLGAALTDVPGSSLAYRGGVVAYASDLKVSLAGVDPAQLATAGPVAAGTAAQMAAGVRERLRASYGVATTGVAGPDPQDEQPPGTVYVAVAGPHGGEARSLRLPGDRERVRGYAVVAALDLLRRRLAADARDAGTGTGGRGEAAGPGGG